MSFEKNSPSTVGPGFDDEIPGAVRRVLDHDGTRTEILSAGCGGHIGHVFLGNGLRPRRRGTA